MYYYFDKNHSKYFSGCRVVIRFTQNIPNSKLLLESSDEKRLKSDVGFLLHRLESIELK